MGFLSFLFGIVGRILSIICYVFMELLVFGIIYYVVKDMGYTKTAGILLVIFVIWIIVDVIVRIIGSTFTSLYDFLIGRFLK